jgi:hypothetical protein
MSGSSTAPKLTTGDDGTGCWGSVMQCDRPCKRVGVAPSLHDRLRRPQGPLIEVALDVRPLPVADLRHIVAVLSNVLVVIDKPGAHRLFRKSRGLGG